MPTQVSLEQDELREKVVEVMRPEEVFYEKN